MKIVVFLAEPLRVRNGAVERMSGLVEFELTCFRSLYCFCEKCSNFARVQRFKIAGRLESLLKDRERIAAGDDDTRGEIHSVV